MLVVDEKRKISMDKNRNNLTVKIKKSNLTLLLLTGILALLLLASCNGVVPGPPALPEPDDDIADSHKVTIIAPYYEKEEEKSYCLISKGVIVTNYESSQKVLTQQELADEIFLGFGVGATMEDLVNYINSRSDLNLKVEIQYLSIIEIQRMLEDDIVPIVKAVYGSHVYLPVAYNKITEEITNYATLTGNEITAGQFEFFNLDNNKSVIIVNPEKLSTYLDNLSKAIPLNSLFELA